MACTASNVATPVSTCANTCWIHVAHEINELNRLLPDNNSTVRSTYKQRVQTPCKAELDVGVLQQRFHESMRHSTTMLPSLNSKQHIKRNPRVSLRSSLTILYGQHSAHFQNQQSVTKPTQRRSTPVPDHDCALRLQRRFVGVHQQLQQERLGLAQNLRGA